MLCVASDTQSMMSDETNLSADGQDSPPDMDSASGIPTLLPTGLPYHTCVFSHFSDANQLATQLTKDLFQPINSAFKHKI